LPTRLATIAALLCLPLLAAPSLASSRLISGGNVGWQGWTAGIAWNCAERDVVGNRRTNCPFPTKPYWESVELNTGVLRSPKFTVSSDIIRIMVNGWDTKAGGAGRNVFTLKLSSDDRVVRRAEPPQQDGFVPRSWAVTDLIGQEVYIEARDPIAAVGPGSPIRTATSSIAPSPLYIAVLVGPGSPIRTSPGPPPLAPRPLAST